MLETVGTASKKRRLRTPAFLVGLTGNWGTGKSTVARLFREKGAQVIDADQVAHEVFKKQSRLYQQVSSLFPELKGDLNRSKVAGVVFQDPERRRRLESLVHPYVYRRIQEEIRRTKRRVVVLEVPLLFETGFHQRLDRTVVVKAPQAVVLRRLAGKGHLPSEVQARWKAQMPLEEKIRLADDVIDNSDGFSQTRRQVVQIWNQIERSLSQYGQRKK